MTDFNIVVKYTSELSGTEVYLLADLVNTCFYKGTVPEKTVRDIFFSDPEILNFVVEDNDKAIGVFQSKDLPRVESGYIFSASIHPAYRHRGIFPEIVDKKIHHFKELERKYVASRSMNPAVIEFAIKRGFFLPETKNPELLKKAKEILIELEGSDLGIRSDFVVSAAGYPDLKDTDPCKDKEIASFLNAHLKGPGDRLFLIRKL